MWWAGLDSNQRRRKPPDLQSGPFDRFGTDPREVAMERTIDVSSLSHSFRALKHGAPTPSLLSLPSLPSIPSLRPLPPPPPQLLSREIANDEEEEPEEGRVRDSRKRSHHPFLANVVVPAHSYVAKFFPWRGRRVFV